MSIVRVTMTQFMDFSFAAPTRKKGVVRKIKNPDQFPNYYEPVQKAMVHALYGKEASGYSHCTDLLKTCHLKGINESHSKNLRAVATSFLEYLSNNKIRNLEGHGKTGKVNYQLGDLRVGIWGDLAARINGRKFLLKLYMKEPEPQEGYDQVASGLFMLAFPNFAEQGIHPRILRVRRPSRIFRAPKNLKEIESVLNHEADSFLRYWDEV